MVRAKFRVSSIKLTEGSKDRLDSITGLPEKDERGYNKRDICELTTVELFPVYGNGDRSEAREHEVLAGQSVGQDRAGHDQSRRRRGVQDRAGVLCGLHAGRRSETAGLMRTQLHRREVTNVRVKPLTLNLHSLNDPRVSAALR